MATLKHADSKKNMYSWWWNSHISPKNSKWLQENLTDMDVKVKSMIKLIEEDADSFARRAEMYYKKRPELMKLVEEFYRAYRALAERYDHATGALRQAHQTMAEAFPNQIPLNPEDSPANSDTDPRTPEMSTSEDLQKGASYRNYGGKRNGGAFSDGSEGRVRKGLNFNMAEEDGAHSESKQGGKMEKEIISLKESLAKIEAEKEAALIQYEESLERLSKLGLEAALAQKISRETTERASKAEAEAQALKEALSRLEDETEGNLLQYRECLEKITVLENDLSQAKAVEKEAEYLKQLAKLEAEKDAALDQYKQSLKMISDLEEKLRQAVDDARMFNERAEKAEGEVVILKQMIDKLAEEKEVEGVLYQQCLKTIASLEHKLLLAQEEAERLNGEIDDGVAKLKGAEEQCVVLERSNRNLHAELESMVVKVGSRSQELTEKQKELGRLWTSVQEERLRFVEAETAFQTLQHLHSQAQEELRTLASELQSRAHILKEMEIRNQSLQDEILSYKEENKNLNELNLASATLTKDMRDEIFSLKESKGKLEDEIDLRTDQRNALQQEIYCLKEELNELNRKHRVILEQVDTVGLNPECLGSSVKELQDDNLNLKEVCQRERSERLALLEKLKIKEISLSDLQEEIFSLKESKEKLEEEVDRRVVQGNSLQLEIDSLKAELKELNQKHRIILEQVDVVGLKPESIGSSVKALQDENSNLQEVSQSERSEKLALLEKLEIMGQLLEKNAVLENSLSDLSTDLEGVRGKLKVIEDSCQSLLEEKSTLAVEKASLLDQLRVTTEDLEKLSEKNSVMENSLSDAHAELEVLKSKSKSLEDSCQLLTVEKSALVTEKGSLVSDLEITQKSLKNLEIRYAELERERASTLAKVDELGRSLGVQKQEHDRYAQMNGEQLAGLVGQIRKLEEEGAETRKDYEEELDKGFSLQTETFILVRSIQDLEEKNFSLVNDFQKLLEASKSSEKLICVLEKEKTENQVTNKSLSDHINALRVQMHQLLMVFNIGVDRECEDKKRHDQLCIKHILSKAEDTKNALFETEDESRQLAVEVSILVTLLRQLRAELTNLESEKNSLDQELTSKNEKLLELQGEVHKLHERNEELGSKLIEGEQKEEILIAQIENLRGELLEVHGTYGNLQTENLQIHKEKMMLMKELSDVEDRVHAVEGLNSNFVDELYEQSIVVLVLKNCLEEKSVAMCGLGEDLDKLNGFNSVLLEKLTVMERELEGVQTENQDLKETLQKSEHELETVGFVRDEFNCEILNVKNLLCQKEREFSEAEEKLELTENEKTELYGIVKDLKREYNEVKTTSEEQGKQIQMLELELDQLREEHKKTASELEKETNGVKVLETQAEEIYGQFQTSDIYQALLVLKARELAEAFGGLESENGGLKSQLASYGSALVSLRDCIVSLENQTGAQRSNEDVKGAELVNDGSVEGSDEYSDFLDLQKRIKTIENSFIELERLRMQENIDANTKLESVTRQMEELKLRRSYHKGERKPTSEILEVGTKDIVLDQESESSSHEKSKREDENQNQMLELWETTYQDGSIDLTVGKSKRIVKPKNEDVVMEKELGVDKLEISKRFKEPRDEGNKRKVLERLNSDDQKLTNLHITVQDLKKKVEITEKDQRGKAAIQCDNIKTQLEEAETDIQKLFDLTVKLMKNIEDSSFSPEKNELEEIKSTRRKRTTEQARRISEKIGRLQLEVQKIQFALLKLDDDKESKGRSRYLDTSKRVLLKDYLYGGGRTKATIHRKKKAPFCACVDPPISD